MVSSMKWRKKLCLTFEKDFIRKVSDWITENICDNCIPKTTFKFTQVPTFSALTEMHRARRGREKLVLAITTSHRRVTTHHQHSFEKNESDHQHNNLQDYFAHCEAYRFLAATAVKLNYNQRFLNVNFRRRRSGSLILSEYE